MNTFRLSICLTILFILLGCQDNRPSIDYEVEVKYLRPHRIGTNGIVLFSHNTRTGENHELIEPFWDKITVDGCGQDDFTPEDDPMYHVIIDINKSPEVRNIADEFQPMEMPPGTRGTPMNATDMGLKRESYASMGLTDIDGVFMFREACHRGKGLIGLRAYTVRQIPPTKSISFCLIYEKELDTIILVDSLWRKKGDKNRVFENVYFSNDGEYFFYEKQNHALRFNIETHQIDTLPGGDVPVIPWNTNDVLVYSNKDETLSLLNDRLEVVKSFGTGRIGGVLSAYAINDSCFLIGTRFYESAALGFKQIPMMKLTIHDFSRNNSKEMLSVSRAFQIIDAKIID